jgi:hypothetical protein
MTLLDKFCDLQVCATENSVNIQKSNKIDQIKRFKFFENIFFYQFINSKINLLFE